MFDDIRAVWPYIFSANNRGKVIGSVALDLATTALNVVPPVLISQYFDTPSETEENDTTFPLVLTGIAAALIISQLLPKVRSILVDSVRANVQKELTNSMIKKSFEIELDEILTTPAGQFTDALSKNYNSVDKGLPAFFSNIVPFGLETVAITIVLSIVSDWMGVVPPVILSMYIPYSLYRENKAKSVREECSETTRDAYGKVVQTIGNYTIAHQFGNVSHELQKINTVMTRSEDLFRKSHTTDDITALHLSMINSLGFVGGLALALLAPSHGKFDLVTFALVAYFLFRINIKLETLSSSISNFNAAMVDIKKIIVFLNRQSIITKASPGILSSISPLDVEFRNVVFSYNTKGYQLSLIPKGEENILFVESNGDGCLQYRIKTDTNFMFGQIDVDALATMGIVLSGIALTDRNLNDILQLKLNAILDKIFNHDHRQISRTNRLCLMPKNEESTLFLETNGDGCLQYRIKIGINFILDIINENDLLQMGIQRLGAVLTEQDLNDIFRPRLNKILHITSSRGHTQIKKILNDISFKVGSGQKVAIVGATGCGKSSLLKLLQDFYQSDSGEILISGRPISSILSEALRAHISVVAQDSIMFDGSIRDNIRYGDLSATDDDVYYAALFSGLIETGDVDKLLDEPVGQQGGKISGGQKQRIAIARSLLHCGDVYLLDEATSALDADTERAVQQTLDELTANATVLVVSHHYSSVINADLILYLENGVIVEMGTFTQLRAQAGRFFEQFKTQCQELGLSLDDFRNPPPRAAVSNSQFNIWYQQRRAVKRPNIEDSYALTQSTQQSTIMSPLLRMGGNNETV